jgi:N-methylhydantoinase A
LTERGLAAGTVRGYVGHADRFLDGLGPVALADVTAAEVIAAVMGESATVSVSTTQNFVADPSGEEEVAAALTSPVVLSSVVSPEFREYERLATTVLSAYLTPSVADYLARLDTRLEIDTRLVMTSAGGLVPFAEGGDVAGRLVLSGPAGGAVAAAALGEHHGFDSVISFDMGGTSTDVCRITGGVPAVSTGHHVAGRVNRVPSVPIRTIGAGGGSVAWVDDGGALRVGPRSAGASPGPAVYGLGGSELTVTDANVLLGHIPRDLALGGSVRLSLRAAHVAARRLADDAGLDVERLVSGVLEVVDSHMERALRSVTIEEGADPRESALVAFGGAGGLHAGRLARRLAIERVLVPPHSGVFSALGLLLAAPRADAVRTVMLDDGAALQQAATLIGEEAGERFQTMFGRPAGETTLTADMRYPGQAHELVIPLVEDWPGQVIRFHEAHRERFGFDRPDQTPEVVNVRATSHGEAPMSWADLPGGTAEVEPIGANGVWRRDSLPIGFEIEGPAVVVEDNSATLLESGDRMTVLADGTLEILV